MKINQLVDTARCGKRVVNIHRKLRQTHRHRHRRYLIDPLPKAQFFLMKPTSMVYLYHLG